MTNRELNAQIRKELKEAGYNTKDFRVSVKDCGYSTSIHVTIKNPFVSRARVEKTLKNREIIDRDTFTYEVLEGGNTYLFVNYEYGIFNEVSQKWANVAVNAMNSGMETTELAKGLYLLNINHSGNREIVQQSGAENHRRIINDLQELCVYIFKYMRFGNIAM